MFSLSAEYRNTHSAASLDVSVCVYDARNNSMENKMGQYAHSRNSGLCCVWVCVCVCVFVGGWIIDHSPAGRQGWMCVCVCVYLSVWYNRLMILWPRAAYSARVKTQTCDCFVLLILEEAGGCCSAFYAPGFIFYWRDLQLLLRNQLVTDTNVWSAWSAHSGDS